ncbi:MAG: hypothetical protein F4213_07480 [Boseongicola sp. SB0677_bin_26]|nr:hypothetical protein [Boseongicola sp. SB0665_bin_10]MYG25852.1 hypothetical protein [Boseongicola sp. SB0677_bin_26]
MNEKRSAALLVALLACLPAHAQGPGWQVEDRITWARAVETSDGVEARLEVRCESEPVVRVFHDAFDAMPEDSYDIRPHWYRIVRVRGGWGLDLRRHDHQGEVTYWRRCPRTPGCLRARDTEWIVQQLKSSWTWFLRVEPDGGSVVDMRFDLAGSRLAIDAACRDRD